MYLLFLMLIGLPTNVTENKSLQLEERWIGDFDGMASRRLVRVLGSTIGIDIHSFVDPGIFKQEVSKMCEHIRSLQPAEGFDAVQLPGDRGDAQRKRLVASGEIDLDAGLVESLGLLEQ